MEDRRFTRREFVKLGAVTGGLALGGAAAVTPALGNRHPHPRPTSLSYLDRNMYRKDTDVLAHFEPGEERGAKMQMMAIGARRFLFSRGDVIEVTEPLRPRMFNKRGYVGGQLQLAYNTKLGKWILMTGRGSRGTFATDKAPRASTMIRR